ncbi:MAG: zinc ribbon domain-containing protein [Acidobacteriota bacterium]
MKEKTRMEFNKNEGAVHDSSTNVEAVSSAAELDLYDELIAFATLSPAEQRRLVARPEKSAENAAEPPDPESVSTQPAIKPVEEESSEPAAESVSDSEDSNAQGQIGDVSPELFDRSRTGALLASLSVSPDFVFAGDLSRGVCLACGAESGADDLFCVTCGVFIDEIDSRPAFKPTCSECGQRIAVDEIFCPWCGAAPAA